MKERPIIFTAPEVRAILAGRKTMARRVVKPQPYPNGYRFDGREILCHIDDLPANAMLLDVGRGKARYTTSNLEGWDLHCPCGQTGDRLWVREAFSHFERRDELLPGARIFYRADGESCELEPWRPSIHMPRWASRITLEIESVRVERLQDISEADAMAEGWPKVGNPGAHTGGNGGPFDWYRSLWEQINGDGSWSANPWVWVLSFRRVTP